MARKQAVSHSDTPAGQKSVKPRPYSDYQCLACKDESIEDSDQPIVNRWCGHCWNITKKKFLRIHPAIPIEY